MGTKLWSRRIGRNLAITVCALALVALALLRELTVEKKSIQLLKAHVGIQEKLPDPAKIELAGDWYFLDHISSGLVGYDHVAGKFRPLLAESWEAFSSGAHTFTLREDAKFHDGTPITSQDVIASIKRLLIKRTSTHFPLWEYIEGCENLKNLSSECSGLHAINHRTIEIRLKRASESFFLQMASPETGIWSQEDIDEETLEMRPKKFSGPYYFKNFSGGAAHLVRNEYNQFSKEFPQSPRRIDLSTLAIGEAEKEFRNGSLDILFKSHNPYAEKDWTGFDTLASSLSTLIYLHGTSQQGASKIGRDFLNSVWNDNTDKDLVNAQKFLPFAGDFSLSQEELINALPPQSTPTIKIATPWTYFSDGFLKLLVDSGRKAGINVEIVRLERNAWIKSFENKEAEKHYDFILAPYAASERYPAVQLRYITGSLRKAPIDLKDAETPDLTPDKVAILRDYQKWLLKNQHAVPLFFVRDFFLYQKPVDMGEQPPSDAEIELWRVTGK